MVDLFRFLILRSPDPLPAGDTIVCSGGELASQVIAGRASQSPGQAVQQAVQKYQTSSDFVSDPASLNLAKPLADLNARLGEQPPTGLQAISQLLESVFGGSASQLVAANPFQDDRRRVDESLLALKLAQPRSGPLLGDLIEIRRLLALIARVAAQDASLDKPGALTTLFQSLILLPEGVLPLPSTLVQEPPPKSGGTPDPEPLVKQAQALKEALGALAVASGSDYYSAPKAPSPANANQVASQPASLDPGSNPGSGDQTADSRLVSASAITASLPEPWTVGLSSGGILSTAAIAQLPATVKTTLAGLGQNLLTTPMPMVVETLTRNLSALSWGEKKAVDPRSLSRYDPVVEPADPDEASDGPPATLPTPPVHTHGQLKPAGIADLLVVKQHLVGYEPGEVAYIENISRGEVLKRGTRRAETSELTTTTETETTRESERDLQSTDRFDLRRESGSIVTSDQGRLPGSGASESYGALVETGGSKQLSQREAAGYSQDVTRRAVSKLTERTRTQVIQRTLHEFEETTTHDFDNSGKPSDEFVVYQWVDKVYNAQVFTYGKRTLYDLVVPEPSAFLTRALAQRQVPPQSQTLVKPAPFTLGADEIDQYNYWYYAAGYGASGVQPPPEPSKTVAKTFSDEAKDLDSPSISANSVRKPQNLELPIPDGYRAATMTAVMSWLPNLSVSISIGSDPPPTVTLGGVDLAVGTKSLHFDSSVGAKQSTQLNGEQGMIPVTVLVTGKLQEYTVALEIGCQRTDQNYQKWQSQTHDAILQAAREREAEYEDRLANVQSALRLLSFSQSADQKRTLQKTELKKACLSIMSNQQFDVFNSIEHSSQGYPQPFLPNIEPAGSYIRFFEQAFEWEQMMYTYYPYFWGRKKYWTGRVLAADEDPAFTAFLRAGAARVLLPVRPGFEPVVSSFMETGNVPTSEKLGQITSDVYGPFLREMMAGAGAPDDGQPYGQSWEVHVPTTLVKLRTDRTLPRWQAVEDAQHHVTWTPAPGDPLN